MDQTTPDAAFPRRVEIPIRLDDNPRYKGSVHDDEVARRLGYKAALVPGAFVYGHMSRLAIEAWGTDWARRGRMFARFRRPVYNGDVLAAEASALERSPDGLRAAVTMRNEDGEEVATGWIGLPEGEPAPPPIESLPVERLPDPRRAVGPGAMTVGMRVGSRNAVLTHEDVRISLSAFDERHPLYAIRASFIPVAWSASPWRTRIRASTIQARSSSSPARRSITGSSSPANGSRPLGP
jgi:hypothetical protein